MKTINYELAKKLYNAGVVIESEYGINIAGRILKISPQNQPLYPAPNVEEVIEFLPASEINGFHLSIEFYSGLTIIKYVKSGTILFPCIEENTLLEALEATLEYLLYSGHIGNQN